MNNSHGGGLRAAALEFGVPEPAFLDFSANLNPLGLPSPVEKGLRRHLSSIVRYPDPRCSDLVGRLSTYHQVDPEALLIGNGSSELIYLLARALTSGGALIPVPTFSEYERAVKASGGQVTRMYMEEDDGFRLVPERLLHQLDSVSVVFLGHPNNPTGTVVPRNALLGIAEECEQREIFLVVDEAFVDFLETAESVSLVDSIRGFDHLIVLRSFTKTYALPGLRLGYVVANPSVVKRLRSFQPSWSVNALAQIAGVMALDCTAYLHRTRELIRRERKFLLNGLAQTDGIIPFPSEANFILCRIDNGPVDAVELRKLLGQQGILIREGSSFEGLGRRFFRIAVRTRRENKILLEALKNAVCLTVSHNLGQSLPHTNRIYSRSSPR